MITFSTDGNYIASRLINGEIVLWEAATGAVHSTLDSYLSETVTIRFLKNGILASMHLDGTVRLFDQVTGVLFRTLETPVEDCRLAAHDDMYKEASVSILPSGDLLILFETGQLWVWNWESNSWSERRVTGTSIRRVYGSFLNGLLVAGIGQNDYDLVDLCLLDTYTSQIQIIEADMSPFRGGPVAISSLDIIAWQGEDGAIELINTNNMSRTKLEGHPEIDSLTFSPDGSMLISSHDDGALLLWDLSAQSKLLVDRTASRIYSIAFSPDSKQMATRMVNSVNLYRFPVRDMSSLQDDRSGESPGISMSPNGQQIAVLATDMIQVYDIRNGELKHRLSGRYSFDCVIAFSPNNEQLASVSYKPPLRVWDLRTGALDWTVDQKQNTSAAFLRFSPDGRYLVSGDNEGEILVLDAKSGNVIHVFEMAAYTNTVQFSSNGHRIACSTDYWEVGDDASARLIGVWDTITGELLHDIVKDELPDEIGKSAVDGSTDFILVTATISPNGRYLAYSLGDLAVVIYDLESKQQRDFPIAHDPFAGSMVFSRDSKSLVTCTGDGGIKQSDIETARLIGDFPLNIWSRWLSFSETGSYLEFKNGRIPIHPTEGDLSNRPSRHLTHWWYDRNVYWFMEGTRKMLWIPPAYRPLSDSNHIAHHDGLFVFSNINGIHYYKFNQGEEVTDPVEHVGNF